MGYSTLLQERPDVDHVLTKVEGGGVITLIPTLLPTLGEGVGI